MSASVLKFRRPAIAPRWGLTSAHSLPAPLGGRSWGVVALQPSQGHHDQGHRDTDSPVCEVHDKI